MWRKMYDQNLLYQMDKAFKFDENVQAVHFDELGRWKKNDIKGLRKSKSNSNSLTTPRLISVTPFLNSNSWSQTCGGFYLNGF